MKKEEIKAMLPELPLSFRADHIAPDSEVLFVKQVQAWLDKLTEGATVVEGQICADGSFYQGEAGARTNTHKVLAIPLGEIKKQTPLDIAVEALQKLASESSLTISSEQFARYTLAKIEAAK